MLGWIRIVGDLVHLLSLILLLRKIWTTSSCTGISRRTQELYLLVFLTRYVDVFWNFHSIYNSILKVLFVITTSCIVYLIRVKTKSSYIEYEQQDSLGYRYLILPSVILAFLWNEQPWGFLSAPFEISWAFSIYLEAVAILPQCVLNRARRGLVDILTADYVFCLGLYRLLYFLSWVLRWIFDETYVHSWIAFMGGIVQILFYCDFFYFYLVGRRDRKIQLPV